MPSKTILFIHGMYMTPLCWEHWLDFFQAKGYRCIAPAWPERDKPVQELRKIHPDPQLGHLTLSRVIEHYADLIHMLEEKPILIGHSMGGLVVQVLLQRYEAIAGVAIDDGRNAPIGIDLEEPIFFLLFGAEIDAVHFVRQRHFFEHDGGFEPVGSRGGVKIDHGLFSWSFEAIHGNGNPRIQVRRALKNAFSTSPVAAASPARAISGRW